MSAIDVICLAGRTQKQIQGVQNYPNIASIGGTLSCCNYMRCHLGFVQDDFQWSDQEGQDY